MNNVRGTQGDDGHWRGALGHGQWDMDTGRTLGHGHWKRDTRTRTLDRTLGHGHLEGHKDMMDTEEEH